MKPKIKYYYRGQIERVRKGGRFAWYSGWSANGRTGRVRYPWMTKSECRAAAKAAGATAVFVDPREEKKT